MTEEEYQSLIEFRGLPLYDERDPNCESIERPMDWAFTGAVLEATDLGTAKQYIFQRDLVPKGGIRYTETDTTVVFAYFWRRR